MIIYEWFLCKYGRGGSDHIYVLLAFSDVFSDFFYKFHNESGDVSRNVREIPKMCIKIGAKTADSRLHMLRKCERTFEQCLLECSGLISAKTCKSCRARRELSNEY